MLWPNSDGLALNRVLDTNTIFNQYLAVSVQYYNMHIYYETATWLTFHLSNDVIAGDLKWHFKVILADGMLSRVSVSRIYNLLS